MEKLPNIHPGEILLEEFLIPLNINKSLIKAIFKIEICTFKLKIFMK